MKYNTGTTEFLNKVVALIPMIVIVALVLVPISSMLDTSVEVDNVGVQFTKAEGDISKEFLTTQVENTPIVIADTFSIQYFNGVYNIYGEGTEEVADTLTIETSGNEAIIYASYSDEPNTYIFTIGWLFYMDEEGSYRATSEDISVMVEEVDKDKIYASGQGDFSTYWSYGNGETKVVREI